MALSTLWVDVTWTVWLLSELVGTYIVPAVRRRASGTVERRRADRGSGLLILIGLFGSLLVVSAFRAAGLATLPTTVGYLGVALVALGIGIRQWAIAVLGRFFSPAVRVVAEHRVVSEGPYRLVRHPSYTGALISLLGVGLVGGSWEGTLLIVVVASVVFGYRIHVEERLLVDQLGADYVAYQHRTKRLIPFVF